MSRTSRVAVAAVTSVLILFALTACSSFSDSAPRASSEAAPDPQALNEEALLAYVEAERATIPQIMALYPDLYSEVSIEGSFEDSQGDQGIPAGTYAVLWFDYTYASPMDWSRTIGGLDGQRSAIDDACETALFPAMRNAGITGPMSVVYSYGDISSGGTMWSYSCSDY